MIGFWHGHLVGDPVPGSTDHRGRSPLGPDLHLIVARATGRAPEVRAWIATDIGFDPVELVD